MTDWWLYIQALIYVVTAANISSITGFLPTVVSQLGYKSSTSGNLMTVPPYACVLVLMFIVSYSSNHFEERGIHITVVASISAIWYILLANLPQHLSKARYALICLSTACVYATYPPGHAWVANNIGNETKRAIGLGIYTDIGNLGSIARSFFYPSTDGPLYRRGHYIAFAMSPAAAVLALANHIALGAVNAYRDCKYGKSDPDVVMDVTEDADNLPAFRFIV